MKKRWDAVTVGEIYNDHVFSGLLNWPQPGEEIFTRNYLRELGGGAAITACGLSLLGRKTAVFGVVGEVEAPWIKRRLKDFGVATDGLRQAHGSSGVTVSVSVLDERSFYSYAGSNELLNEYIASSDVLEQIHEASHVHFAVPLDRRVAENVLPSLKSAGCTVSLDLGWQPEWYRNTQNLQTCLEIDYFLPNRKEAEYLTGHKHPEQVLLGLERLGLTHVVVKLGADGAAIHTSGRMLQVSPPRVDVVDTTGAGDAFDAGLIDAVLDDASPLETLQRAAICGALSTRAVGALNGLATRIELEEVYGKS
ncbi:MAG: carbohydrate kinase family protein [Edaphobacter sp.]|jgi:sugar/nucleoside kinase (ribokinase family)